MFVPAPTTAAGPARARARPGLVGEAGADEAVVVQDVVHVPRRRRRRRSPSRGGRGRGRFRCSRRSGSGWLPRLEPKRSLAVHLQLERLVVGRAEEVGAGSGAGVSAQAPGASRSADRLAGDAAVGVHDPDRLAGGAGSRHPFAAPPVDPVQQVGVQVADLGGGVDLERRSAGAADQAERRSAAGVLDDQFGVAVAPVSVLFWLTVFTWPRLKTPPTLLPARAGWW